MTTTNLDGTGFAASRRPRHLTRRATVQGGFRTDIQALRALAVVLVVLNHLWPNSLTGGFVGVDVFFVISGFLITSHLAKELFRTGKIEMTVFYARRIRRLLPAAFLVLAVSLLAAWLILPYTRWVSTVQEVLGSTFYVENWLLAVKSVDYSAMSESATVAQHYWSLSVEEQFYFLWPMALMGLYVLARKKSVLGRSLLVNGIVALSVLSLCLSVYVTSVAHNQAYFVTPVRVWEFGLGALIALVGTRAKIPVGVQNIIGLLGFFMIAFAAVTFGPETPFPGWTALLPTVGTALVIWSGFSGQRLWHDRATSSAPIQFIGNISYSLYLWHWPLIVVAPFIVGAQLTSWHKLLICVISIFLAWLTKRLVEDRWIQRRANGSKSRPVFIGLIAGMVTISLAGGGLLLIGNQLAAKAEATSAQLAADPCFGPATVDRQDQCPDPFRMPVSVPNMGPSNAPYPFPAECPEGLGTLDEGRTGSPLVCDYSQGDPHSETVWIVGDSHAQQWQAAIFDEAKLKHWKVKWSYRGACPLVDATFRGSHGGVADPGDVRSCALWGRSTVDAVEADLPKRVFVSIYSDGEQIDDGTGRPQTQQYADGLMRDWKRWTAKGIAVYPIVDPPLNAEVRSVDCLALNAAIPEKCAADRKTAMPSDPMILAAQQLNSPFIHLLDFTKYFCDDARCYAAVGGLAVYYDTNHLNKEFVRRLIPHFEQAL